MSTVFGHKIQFKNASSGEHCLREKLGAFAERIRVLNRAGALQRHNGSECQAKAQKKKHALKGRLVVCSLGLAR
jgi:hypothetical protein